VFSVPDDQIEVKISATDEGLKAGLDAAVAAVNQLPGTMEGAKEAAGAFSDALSRVGEVAAGVFGGLKLDELIHRAADAFKDAVFGAGEWAESLTNLSTSTGISTDELQRLQFAAKLTGEDTNTLARSFLQLQRRLIELDTGGGSKAFRQAMADFRLSKDDLTDADSALENVASHFKEFAGVLGAARARGDLAEILGGRGGVSIIPILNELDEANAKFKELGLSLSPELVAKSTESKEAMNQLSAEWEHDKIVLGAELAPAISRIADGLGVLRKAAGEAMRGFSEAFGGGYDYLNAGDRIRNLLADSSATVPRVRPQPPPVLPDPKAAIKAATTKFEDYRAELADEEAEAGKDATKKLQLAQDFVEKVRQIQGLPFKDLLAAYRQEETIYQASLAEKQRLALSAVTSQETIAKAGLALQQAQDKAAFEQSTAAIQLRLALGQESKKQELADQLTLGQAKLQADINTETERYTELKNNLDQQLAIQKASRIQESEAINKTNAEIQAAEIEHQAKLLDIDTAATKQRTTQMAQLAAEQTKAIATAFTSILQPISQAFDQMFTGVIQGTQTVAQAFRKMGLDIALSIARSGLTDLLLGAPKENAFASGVFGTQGAGGGLGGLLANAFKGTAISGEVNKLFADAFKAAQSTLKTVFSSIFSGAGGAATSAATPGQSAAGAATQQTGILQKMQEGLQNAQVYLQGIFGNSTAGKLATIVTNTILNSAISLLGIIAAIEAAKIVQPFGFSGGGVVPSAAGGWITHGSSFGIPAILHPREMVLPAPLSERIQNRLGDDDSGSGGGESHVHFHVQVADASGFEKMLERNRGTIEKMVRGHMGRY
jgi:hypothetical protein